ncbi:MAG: cyclase family protein [Verrucomicrobium sp.]|nr:cyclase family protein [Verrucomicrobium sp.]
MKFIDLTHSLRDGQASFPGDPPFRRTPHAVIGKDECNVSLLQIGTHQGTHLDALRHFMPEGLTTEEMPLEWFYGPATVLRIPKGPKEDITVDDFRAFEERLTPGARVLYETGWHRRFREPDFFTDYPSMTEEAAAYVAGRGVRLLGMDTPTPGRHACAVHQALQRDPFRVVIVEALANLDALPDQFTFIGFPLKLEGGDGSPIRAVALCP